MTILGLLLGAFITLNPGVRLLYKAANRQMLRRQALVHPCDSLDQKLIEKILNLFDSVTGSFFVVAGIFMVRGVFVAIEQVQVEAQDSLLLAVGLIVIGIHRSDWQLMNRQNKNFPLGLSKLKTGLTNYV